jgi:transcriptional regulator with XRE-family HTH domain
MADMRDVATLAGVSIATVSRVINGSCSVSAKTRERVLSAVVRLKYHPNPNAAELRRSSGHQKKRGTDGSGGGHFHKDRFSRDSRPQAERERVLEEENRRLKRLLSEIEGSA